jgi:hypothetical protein
VFPSLLVNYAGQAALVLEGARTTENIFYQLCPSMLLVPMVALATVATIIASQAIITGAFSMTRQAILLGWMPAVADRSHLRPRIRPNLRPGGQLAFDVRVEANRSSPARTSAA